MSQPTTLAGAVQINDFENYFNNFLIHKDQQDAVVEESCAVSPGDPGAGCLDHLDLPGDLTLPEPASSSLDHANWDVNASTLQTLDIDDVLAVMDGLSLGNDVCKRNNNDDDDGEKKEVNSQQRRCLGLSSQEKVAECSKKKSPCKKDRHSEDVEKIVVGVRPNKHKDTNDTPRGKAAGGSGAEAGSSKSRSLPNLHDNWFSKFCVTDALHWRAGKHSCNVCKKRYKTIHGLTKHMLKHLPDDAAKEAERVETGSRSVNEGDTSVDEENNGVQCCSRKQSGKATKTGRDDEMEMERTDHKQEIVGTGGSDRKESVGKSGTELCAINVSPRKRLFFCL